MRRLSGPTSAGVLAVRLPQGGGVASSHYHAHCRISHPGNCKDGHMEIRSCAAAITACYPFTPMRLLLHNLIDVLLTCSDGHGARAGVVLQYGDAVGHMHSLDGKLSHTGSVVTLRALQVAHHLQHGDRSLFLLAAAVLLAGHPLSGQQQRGI